MGEAVHEADFTNFREPVLLRLGGKGEELCSDVLQNVAIKTTTSSGGAVLRQEVFQTERRQQVLGFWGVA